MNITSKQSKVLVSEQGSETTRKTYDKYVAFNDLSLMSGFVNIKSNSIDIRLNAPQAINIESASSLLMQAIRAAEPYLSQILTESGKTFAQIIEEQSQPSEDLEEEVTE